MPGSVLFVDDDVNILSAFERNLRRDFSLVTVCSPEEAIQKLEADSSFAVIVADLKMPRMSGVELLTITAERWPDTVRILLTGEADTKAAIAAVNHGHVYRFLIKPLALTPLSRILTEALAQHDLAVSERELTARTLAGSLKVISEILALQHPLASARTARIQSMMNSLVERLGLSNPWEFEAAAMLSLVGFNALPDEILGKMCDGVHLTGEERRAFDSHPATGARLLQSMPRFEAICQMIERQEQILDPLPPGIPLRDIDRITLGAYLLKMANEFDSWTLRGLNKETAMYRMQNGPQPYRPDLLSLLADLEAVTLRRESRTIKFLELSVGMVPQTDILSRDGLLLLAKGQSISRTVLEGLSRYSLACGIREPIQVMMPLAPLDRTLS